MDGMYYTVPPLETASPIPSCRHLDCILYELVQVAVANSQQWYGIVAGSLPKGAKLCAHGIIPEHDCSARSYQFSTG
jgi:hypothetical protein